MVFYRSFFDAIYELPPEEFKKCACAVLEYGFDGKEPETSGIEKTIFIMARPQIDKTMTRYDACVQNGKSGGRPKKQSSSSSENDTEHNQDHNQKGNQRKTKTITKEKPEQKPKKNLNYNYNYNDNVNYNENDNYNENESLNYNVSSCCSSNVECVEHDDNDDGSSQERDSFEYVGGIGKGVVLLTQSQMDLLIDKLGIDGFNHYIEKLADFIIKKDAKVKNHYATILKWVDEDSNV